MKRHIGIFIITGFALTACLPSESTPVPVLHDQLAEIQARGTLVIATDPDYVPQSQLILDAPADPNTKCEPSEYTANQFKGFDVAVAVEVARRLGVEPCFVTPPWGQLVTGKWGNNWDIHVGSVAITYDRMKNLYFSQPYYATPTVVLIHKDNQVFKTPEDLSGKRIGVCAGCTFEEYLQGTLQIPGKEIRYRIHNAQIIGYENEEPAINDLSLGDGIKLDAVLTILPKALAAIHAGKPLKMMDETVSFEYAAVTLDRSSHRDPLRLLTEITNIIEDMHRTGMLKKLSVQYTGVDLTQEAAQFDIATLHQSP